MPPCFYARCQFLWDFSPPHRRPDLPSGDGGGAGGAQHGRVNHHTDHLPLGRARPDEKRAESRVTMDGGRPKLDLINDQIPTMVEWLNAYWRTCGVVVS